MDVDRRCGCRGVRRGAKRLLRVLDPQAVTVICRDEVQRSELESLCPLVESRKAVDDRVTLYACTDFVCQAPIVGKEAVQRFAEKAARRDDP